MTYDKNQRAMTPVEACYTIDNLRNEVATLRNDLDVVKTNIRNLKESTDFGFDTANNRDKIASMRIERLGKLMTWTGATLFCFGVAGLLNSLAILF